MTSAAPESDSEPKCWRCQSFAAPSSALYRHISDTAMRFVAIGPRCRAVSANLCARRDRRGPPENRCSRAPGRPRSSRSGARANVWAYTSIASVREILVLSADRIAAELLRRWPQGVIGNLGQEFLSRRRAVEHPVERQMRRLRPVAASKLQAFDAKIGNGAEKLVEGQRARLSVIMPIFIALPSRGPRAPPRRSAGQGRTGHRRAAALLPGPARPRQPASHCSQPPQAPRALRRNRRSRRPAR